MQEASNTVAKAMSCVYTRG